MAGPGIQFKPNGVGIGTNNQTDETPKAPITQPTIETEKKEDASLNYPYTDERTVTIARVQDYSLYHHLVQMVQSLHLDYMILNCLSLDSL